MSASPIAFARTLCGIPLWLLREYLVELGGEAIAVDRVCGAGWEASLQAVEDYQLGSLRVGRVRLEVRASPEAFALLQARLEKKLLRAGG